MRMGMGVPGRGAVEARATLEGCPVMQTGLSTLFQTLFRSFTPRTLLNH